MRAPVSKHSTTATTAEICFVLGPLSYVHRAEVQANESLWCIHVCAAIDALADSSGLIFLYTNPRTARLTRAINTYKLNPNPSSTLPSTLPSSEYATALPGFALHSTGVTSAFPTVPALSACRLTHESTVRNLTG